MELPTTTKQSLSILEIAKQIGISSQKVKQKAVSMSLPLHQKSLDLPNAIQLVLSYCKSSRLTTEKRAKSLQLYSSIYSTLRNNGYAEDDLKDYPNPQRLSKDVSEVTPINAKVIPVHPRFDPSNLGVNLVQTLSSSTLHILDHAIQGLTSIRFRFISVVVAIIFQMQHNAILFYRVSPPDARSWLNAYGYAFVVDLFVLTFTIHSKQLNTVKVFAWLTFVANLLYFQFWVGFDKTLQSYTNAAANVLISGVMAYIIYAYAELFVEIKKTKK